MSSPWEYFTPEQQKKLKQKFEQFDPEQLKRMRKESNEILGKLRAGLEAEIPPTDPAIVSFARLLEEQKALFHDHDPEYERAIERFHLEHPHQEDHGIDLRFYQYIQKAASAR